MLRISLFHLGQTLGWFELHLEVVALPSFLSSRRVIGVVLSFYLSQGEKTEVMAILPPASGKGDEHDHAPLLPERREQEVMTTPHLCFWASDHDHSSLLPKQRRARGHDHPTTLFLVVG